jgi:hypothetical protein
MPERLESRIEPTIVSGNVAKLGGGLFLNEPATINGSRITGNVSSDEQQIVID